MPKNAEDVAKFKEFVHRRRLEQKMGRCVHFTGVQNKTCEAGISYDSVSNKGVPCLKSVGSVGTCDKLRFTTREEAEDEIAKSNASLARISACLLAIRKKHGKARGLVETMPCPNGCGGELRYSIASVNGHIWGRCSTDGCAAWMQ